MCSIIGFKVKTEDNHEEKIEEYLTILQERGDQSFGYISILPNGDVYYNKSLVVGHMISDIEDMEEGTWCFLHARKASAGMTGVTVEDRLSRAHPVSSDDKSILLIHNGTKNSIHDTVLGSLSDSQGLATLLSFSWENRSIYAGDIGVVLYERAGSVYLYKDGARPLVMSENGSIFCSEPISDEIKWCNVKTTVGTDKFDIELDFSKEDLGIPIDSPTEIKFSLAKHTVVNWSIAGYPKAFLCPICKKRHLECEGNTACCACVIEGKGAKKIVPVYPMVIPKTINNNTGNHVVATSNADGVLYVASKAPLRFDEYEIFTSDISLVKRLGYEVTWGGYAIIKANRLYKSLDNLLFAKPDINGNFSVKVDRAIVKTNYTKQRIAFSPKTNNTLRILGDLDDAGTIPLTCNMNISSGIQLLNSYNNKDIVLEIEVKTSHKPVRYGFKSGLVDTY